MKQLLIVFLLLTSVTSINQETIVPFSTEASDLKTKKMRGTVIEKSFKNKIGKDLGFSEYYIKTKRKEYFIKLSECSVSKDDIIGLLGKNFIFIVSLKNGLWDTDDPNVQSRIGEYAVILGLH